MQAPRANITPSSATIIVGPGRVGNAMFGALERSGRQATLIGRDGINAACRQAEVVLLCVPDSEIEGVGRRVTEVARSLQLIGHTSGATALDALSTAADIGAAAFSIHPLQTVPDSNADLTGAPAAIAGTDAAALAFARTLADDCQMIPFEVPEESRAAYHAAAAIASNFLITLEVGAEQLLAAAGIEGGRDLLAPLVLRSAANWAEHGSDALTGPIARGDEATVQRHLKAIEETAPELAETYRALADRTRAIAATGDRR